MKTKIKKKLIVEQTISDIYKVIIYQCCYRAGNNIGRWTRHAITHYTQNVQYQPQININITLTTAFPFNFTKHHNLKIHRGCPFVKHSLRHEHINIIIAKVAVAKIGNMVCVLFMTKLSICKYKTEWQFGPEANIFFYSFCIYYLYQ